MILCAAWRAVADEDCSGIVALRSRRDWFSRAFCFLISLHTISFYFLAYFTVQCAALTSLVEATALSYVIRMQAHTCAPSEPCVISAALHSRSALAQSFSAARDVNLRDVISLQLLPRNTWRLQLKSQTLRAVRALCSFYFLLHFRRRNSMQLFDAF